MNSIVSRIFDYYRHTLRAQMSLGPRSSAGVFDSTHPKDGKFGIAVSAFKQDFLKPDALEALSTAKVLLLKKIFLVLDHVNYAVNPLLSPPLNL